MLAVRDLLGKTGDEAAALSKEADADTQAAVGFLLSRLKAKDHRGLVRYLEQERALDELRPDFETFRQKDAGTLARLINAGGRSLTLAALIAAIFILQSVAAGEPLRLNFSQPVALIEYNHEIPHDDPAWIAGQVAKLTDHKLTIAVSAWAETKRYLPPQVTSMPGFYSYDVAPYLREIADCLSVDSFVREFDLMKGAQVGATVGVLENAIGYLIDHVKSAPVMLLTADAELAQIRVDSYITPMLQYSGLSHLIRSSDESNKRKTGKTKARIEWAGGGFLVPFGARNADKLRSISIQVLLEDEVDAFADKVGRDGDPQKLAEARLKAYYESRKIARISTPLIKGRSRIERGYKRGDQRKFFVPCKRCGEKQVLVFRGGRDGGSGRPFGLDWQTENGAVVPGSVRYICRHCQHPHRNSDKAWMLPRGEWRATAPPRDPEHRSYHISALYSPVGMFPWEAIVRDWLEAWDEEANAVRDVGLLQEFYNNVLGEPFEIMGSRVRFAAVSAHRRPVYRKGEVPNEYAARHSGSPVLLVTCQVDVHKRNLAVATMGWTRDMRCYVIDYQRIEAEGNDADCAETSSPVWGKLQGILEETVYTADDGKRYPITLTLIDAGYANDTVTTFCSSYASGVHPILGRERPAKNQAIKEFAEFKTQQGTIGYRILVDHYKDRLAPVLRREWVEDAGEQKPYHFNAPVDMTDKELKELTVETRREKQDENGNLSYYWHRPASARNELWDLLVYGHAAVEIMAWAVCIQHFEAPTIDWPQFRDYIERDQLYFLPPAPAQETAT